MLTWLVSADGGTNALAGLDVVNKYKFTQNLWGVCTWKIFIVLMFNCRVKLEFLIPSILRGS
jgi:hypothetical protein